MADAFRELPHVAGIVDNLQGARVIDRALASLNGEIHRREKIFKAVGINNINDYTRKFGEEEGMELPHLIIIVDEFAELKSEPAGVYERAGERVPRGAFAGHSSHPGHAKAI